MKGRIPSIHSPEAHLLQACGQTSCYRREPAPQADGLATSHLLPTSPPQAHGRNPRSSRGDQKGCVSGLSVWRETKLGTNTTNEEYKTILSAKLYFLRRTPPSLGAGRVLACTELSFIAGFQTMSPSRTWVLYKALSSQGRIELQPPDFLWSLGKQYCPLKNHPQGFCRARRKPLTCLRTSSLFHGTWCSWQSGTPPWFQCPALAHVLRTQLSSKTVLLGRFQKLREVQLHWRK